MLTKFEKTEDKAFMFQAVKDLASKISDFAYKPTILVADAAESITRGYQKVFELKKRIYCWTKVDRNIDKNVLKSIKSDIKSFHHLVEEDNFMTVARLMITKWKNTHEEQWLNPKRMGWFDHYADWTPVQNNAIERTNNHVKGPDGTFRERLEVLQFLKELEERFVYKWSTDRCPTIRYPDGRTEDNFYLKKFNHEPIYELPDLTLACQWGRIEKKFKKFKESFGDIYYCTPRVDKNGKEVKN